jgi:hypothetical protein
MEGLHGKKSIKDSIKQQKLDKSLRGSYNASSAGILMSQAIQYCWEDSSL